MKQPPRRGYKPNQLWDSNVEVALESAVDSEAVVEVAVEKSLTVIWRLEVALGYDHPDISTRTGIVVALYEILSVHAQPW